MNISSITILFVLISILSSNVSLAGEVFGRALSNKKTVELSHLIDNFSNIKGPSVTKGEVVKVCQKSGCWMALTDGKNTIRVTFKDYDFKVPMNLSGQSVRIEGELIRKTVSIEEQKHYLKDEGAPKGKIRKVKAPKLEFSFVATGVEKI